MLIRAQVVMPYFTNQPQDVVTNTFYFAADDSLLFEDAAETANSLLQTFYQSCYTTGRTMASYMASSGSHVNYYNMLDPEPRSPYTLTINPTAVTRSASSLPTEVAVCISYEALPVSGIPQARRRGRIFLGALSETWIQAGSTSSFPVLSPAIMGSVATAAGAFMDACNTALVPWVVYSRTNATPYPIVGGWIDNTPDTQRRRGVPSTSRQLWS